MRLSLSLILLTIVSGCGSVVADEPRPEGTLAPGVVGKSSSRLRLLVVESSTGVQVPIRFHDTVLDIDCSPGRDARGVVRCLPDARSVGPFADAACTTPAVSVYGPCKPPRYASKRVSNCPSSPSTFHEVKQRVEQVHRETTDGCVPSTGVPGDVHYETSKEDVSDRFAAFTEQRRPLGSRFEQVVWVTADGAEWAPGELFDREIGLTCTAKQSVDGALRCLPGAFQISTTYSDATCTTRLVTATACASNDALSLPVSCNGFRSYRIVGPFDGAVFERREGACTSSARPGPFLQTEEILPEKLAPIGSEVGPSGVYATIVDGKRIVGPHDNLREPASGERCNLVPDSAGSYRCVPSTPVEFLDSECTKPVVRVAKAACSSTPPARATLFVLEAPEKCTNSMQVVSLYEVGAEIAAPGPALYTKSSSGGGCYGTSTATNYRVYEAKPLGLDAAPPWRIVTR